VFDKYDYETDDEEEDEDQLEDDRAQREHQQNLGVVTMLQEVAKVMEGKDKALAKLQKDKKPAACTACSIKDREIDKAEQDAYELRQQLDQLRDDTQYAAKQYQRELEALRAENAALRAKLEEASTN
jgi:hypothetical protein